MIRQWRRWGLDAGLLIGALTCFGLFVVRQRHPPSLSQANDPVGTFVNGQASRKTYGVSVYAPIASGVALHNMDTLWIDAGQQATIRWLDGQTIEFGERTLTLLKRPFSSSIALKGQVIVLRGQAKVDGGKILLKPEVPIHETLPAIPPTAPPAVPPRPVPSPSPTSPKITPSPGPSPAPSGAHPLPSISDERILPQPGSVVYVPPGKSASVTFFWSKPLSGFLMIRDETDSGVDFFPIQNERSLKLPRKLGRAYSWQLTDSSKKIVLGPFRFELKAGDLGNLDGLLKQSTEHPTEVRLHSQ